MGDNLEVLAGLHRVGYKPTISAEEVYTYPFREVDPNSQNNKDNSSALNRSMLLQKGIITLDSEFSPIFAVDPRRNPLFEENVDRNLAEFLRMRFTLAMDGMDAFVMNEVYPKMGAGTTKKRQFSFVYTPQEEIDKALSQIVKDYEDKMGLREQYDDRVKLTASEVYRKMLEFVKGRGSLRIPDSVKGMILRKGKRRGMRFADAFESDEYGMVPIHCTDEVWTTIYWLTNFTHTPCSYNGIFEDHDNVLEGNHVEQRVGFDDVGFTVTSQVAGDVEVHLAFCLNAEELTKLPPELSERIIKFRKHLERFYKFERDHMLTNPLLLELAPFAHRNISSLMKILRERGAEQVITSRLPRYCSTALLDERMYVAQQASKQIVRRIR